MKLQKATLNLRIPAIGSEFAVGVNCDAIEEDGVLLVIRRPLTEGAREECSFDLLIAPWGHSKLVRGASALQPGSAELPRIPQGSHACRFCDAMFANSQGLGSHITRKHPGESKE